MHKKIFLTPYYYTLFAGRIEIRDSMAFMPMSLDSLAKTMEPESCKYLSQWIKNCIIKARRETNTRFCLEYNDAKVRYLFCCFI